MDGSAASGGFLAIGNRRLTTVESPSGRFRSHTVWGGVIAGGDPACQHRPAQRDPQSRRSPLKNGFGDEPTNSTSSEATNRAPSWTIGSKPKRKFAWHRKIPSTSTDVSSAVEDVPA